jgi:dienelactone hydrolase
LTGGELAMRGAIRVLALILVAFAQAWTGFAVAQERQPLYLQEQLRIPTPEAGSKGLETVLVRPAAAGKYPLVLLNHGSPRMNADRPGMTPYASLPQIMEFARRGFAVAAVMRRGFGDSGGGFAESAGSCANPDYLASGRSAAKDLRAAIEHLSSRPDIDATRIISVGQSAGGFATVALTADPPPGLVAAISFAGGRGSPKDGEVCAAERLAAAFGAFGKTSRVPMLWIYADNDLFFGPEVVQRLHQAFTGSGGAAELIKHPAFGKDGHALFALGIALWTPHVDAFLKRRNLVLRDGLLPVPVPKVAVPAGLGENGRKAFAFYLSSGQHKAFAMSPNGTFGWRTARRTVEEARKGALENCAKHSPDCRIVVVDETPEPAP